MSKGPIVSDELAQKFANREGHALRALGPQAKGLDIKPAMYVRQLRTIALKPWAWSAAAAASSSTTNQRAPPTTPMSAKSPPAAS
jgi:hypothetical protein